ERPFAAVPGAFLPLDASSDGALLARRSNSRREIISAAGGRDLNLPCLDWSYPNDLSDDGKLVLFDEQSTGRANYLCYVRKTDGSPAVLLGKAHGFGLSPDGKWALTCNETADRLTLLPTGAGTPKELPRVA